MLFVLVAAVLYAVAPPDRSAVEADFVRVSKADLDLRELLARRATGGKTVDHEELRQQAIEDAILEHEGRRLGLAEGDLVVRRRLVQKALFLAEDLHGAFREPTVAELRAFHAAHPERFRLPGRERFVHVYAAEETALAKVRADVEAFIPSQPDEAPPFGQAFAFPRSVDATSEAIIDRYGESFGRAVGEAPLGVWTGPLRSKFDPHPFRWTG